MPKRHYPLPEAITGEAFSISESPFKEACASRVSREMVVPLDGSVQSESVRLHEVRGVVRDACVTDPVDRSCGVPQEVVCRRKSVRHHERL